MRFFLLIILLYYGLVSCVSKEKEVQGKSLVFSKENDLIKEQKSIIISLSDAYELDSAAALLSRIDSSKLDNPLYKGLYHYLDAYILDYQEKYGESIAMYQKAIEVFEQNGLDKTLELGLAYNDLAYVYNEVSLEAEALKNYKKAFEIIWNYHQNDPSQVSSVSNNYLGALIGYGDKLNAKEIFEKAEKYFATFLKNKSGYLAKSEDEKLDLLSLHYLSAVKYMKLNFEEDKLNLFIKKMESLFAKTNEELKAKYASRLIYAYDYAGYALLGVKSYEKAEKQFWKMNNIAVSESDKMKSHSNFAALFLQSGQYAKAEKSYLESLKFIKPDKNDISYLMLLTAKAWMVNKQGRQEEALSSIYNLWNILGYDKTKLSAIKLEDLGQVNSTRWMFILNATSEIARKYYEQNLQEKHILDDAKNMATLAAKMFQVYYEKEAFNAELSLQNNANREAMLNALILDKSDNFEFGISLLENNTSQHLWKTFLAKNEEQINIPKELIEARNMLAISKLSDTGDTFEKLESIQNKIEKEAFGFEKNKYRPISLTTLQQKLKPKEAIIRYIHAEENVFAIYLAPKQLRLYKIGKITSVDSLASLHHDNLKSLNKSYSHTATSLYELLITPLGIAKDLSQLTIITENSLQNVPFETLIKPNGESLGLHVPIRYSHSFHFENTAPVKNRNNGIIAFAPSYPSESGLEKLENTAKEIAQISAVFAGTYLTGDQASKLAFISEMGNYDIQHFAMHAVLDITDHEDSKLIFSNNEALKFKEIYSLNIPAELITLSACNTGIGSYQSGEGLMSLSRALVYAGTRSVVHSLWRIPDEETAEIMGYFYTNLKEGRSKSEALQQAKISFVKANPLKQHPYFWAGFILNGDNEPIKSSVSFPWKLLTTLVLISAIVVYFFRKRSFALTRQSLQDVA